MAYLRISTCHTLSPKISIFGKIKNVKASFKKSEAFSWNSKSTPIGKLKNENKDKMNDQWSGFFLQKVLKFNKLKR
jgi:hypothetical protein